MASYGQSSSWSGNSFPQPQMPQNYQGPSQGQGQNWQQGPPHQGQQGQNWHQGPPHQGHQQNWQQGPPMQQNWQQGPHQGHQQNWHQGPSQQNWQQGPNQGQLCKHKSITPYLMVGNLIQEYKDFAKIPYRDITLKYKCPRCTRNVHYNIMGLGVTVDTQTAMVDVKKSKKDKERPTVLDCTTTERKLSKEYMDNIKKTFFKLEPLTEEEQNQKRMQRQNRNQGGYHQQGGYQQQNPRYNNGNHQQNNQQNNQQNEQKKSTVVSSLPGSIPTLPLQFQNSSNFQISSPQQTSPQQTSPQQ